MKRTASTILAGAIVAFALLSSAAAAHADETPEPTPVVTETAAPVPTETPAPVDTAAPVPPFTLDCPAGTVPGWLDENGNPTSCVDDHPCIVGSPAPECAPDAGETPAPTAETPATALETATVLGPPADELADTGMNVGQYVTLGGIALVCIGLGLYLKREARA